MVCGVCRAEQRWARLSPLLSGWIICTLATHTRALTGALCEGLSLQETQGTACNDHRLYTMRGSVCLSVSLSGLAQTPNDKQLYEYVSLVVGVWLVCGWCVVGVWLACFLRVFGVLLAFAWRFLVVCFPCACRVYVAIVPAHVCTPVTNIALLCRLLLEKNTCLCNTTPCLNWDTRRDG